MSIRPLTLSRKIFWQGSKSIEPAARVQLVEAAEKVLPYARSLAWSRLYDEDRASEIVERALGIAESRLLAKPQSLGPEQALSILRSCVRVVARCEAKKQQRFTSLDAMPATDHLLVAAEDNSPEAACIRDELVAMLSPKARRIYHARRLGYTWREIEKLLECSRRAAERAYTGELNRLLFKVSRHRLGPNVDGSSPADAEAEKNGFWFRAASVRGGRAVFRAGEGLQQDE